MSIPSCCDCNESIKKKTSIICSKRIKKHHIFLNERSEIPNEKGKYSELNIEKTTNRIEGLFKELKDKLRTHSGLTRKYKILFIQDFFNKKAGKDYQI